MKLRILLVLCVCMVLAVPSVMAVSFSLQCPESDEGSLTCQLNYVELDPNDFGGIRFNLATNNVNLVGNLTTTNGLLIYNGGFAQLAYNYAGINPAGTLVSFNLDQAVAPASITLNNFEFLDANSVATAMGPFSTQIAIQALAPNCEDNTQNQDETGVDCGGSCANCPVDDGQVECVAPNEVINGVCTDVITQIRNALNGVGIVEPNGPLQKLSAIARILGNYFFG